MTRTVPSKHMILLIAALLLLGQELNAGGKLGIYGIRMTPYGAAARDYARPGWGGGIHAVVPLESMANLVAFDGGLEIVNLLSATKFFQDRLTGLRTEQQTSQNYFRLFVGGEIGGHGNGFIRPHGGIHLALVHYRIDTDVVIPDDFDRENEIRQELQEEGRTIFGYDMTLGVDLNFSNTWTIDGGVRYVKSFSLPQQLGDGSVTVHPDYFQIYLGVGISFNAFQGD